MEDGGNGEAQRESYSPLFFDRRFSHCTLRRGQPLAIKAEILEPKF